MSFDSDIALIGTGAASLVAAIHLLAEGKSVLLINPDRDFFLEDSELPFDPWLPLEKSTSRLQRSSAENALQDLRPDFPGAVEFWSGAKGGAGATGFLDRSAPFVRARARLSVSQKGLGELEDLYVLASDAGLNPQILEGLQVTQRFPAGPLPGEAGSEGLRGVWIPKIYDVDVSRYRNGLLEFAREKEQFRLVCDATQIELMPEGIRFHWNGRLHTARLREGAMVFWTPRLSPWVQQQSKRAEVTPVMPKGIRLWEQWSLISRHVIDPNVMGVFGNRTIWAELEGDPSESMPLNHLAMLCAGALLPPELPDFREVMIRNLLNADSLTSLESFFYGFLKWVKVTVRAMMPRAIFEWNQEDSWLLAKNGLRVKVVNGSDGPLADVVRVARQACGEWI